MNEANMTKLKGETEGNTIIVEDFNTLISIMGRTLRQKISKERKDLN